MDKKLFCQMGMDLPMSKSSLLLDVKIEFAACVGCPAGAEGGMFLRC